MKGDFHVGTILYLVIAAIILLIFAPFIVKVAGEAWNTIMIALGVVKMTDIENAILCSYYRCVDGCTSSKVTEEITWKEGDKVVSCNNFCQLPCTEANAGECYTLNKDAPTLDCLINHDFDTCYSNLRVCNDKSFKFPVNITLTTDEKVEKSHLTVVSSNIDVADLKCIFIGPISGSIDILTIINLVPEIVLLHASANLKDNWLLFSQDLVTSKSDMEKCNPFGLTQVSVDTYKTLTVKKGQIDIATLYGTVPLTNLELLATLVARSFSTGSSGSGAGVR